MIKPFSTDLKKIDRIDNEVPDIIEDISKNDIAIIGISVRLAKAHDCRAFWQTIKCGKDCVGEFPEGRRKDIDNYLAYKNMNKEKISYYKGAFINEIDKFDYKFFNITPAEAFLMDPMQRLSLEVIYEAIEDAGYGGNKLSNSSTGVYIGHITDPESHTYKQMILDIDESFSQMSIQGNLSSIIPSRISYYLNLKGPSMLIDTACSSSLVAIHLACQAIKTGDCELAIAGGGRINLFPLSNRIKIGIESTDGRTRTFDDSSDGTGMGEGLAALVLKPLSKAIRDKENIYAVIKGSAINQDGSSMGITAPNVESQESVIINAWRNAGINPETISYIEAHGTGTKLGDPIEIDGIQRAFRRFTDKKQFCAVGSVKANIGHLYGGSGVAGLIKTVIALKNKEIPPSINFRKPNNKINFEESPVYVCDRLTKWETTGYPRRCGVSSFGFSGTNCHIVLEEAPEIGCRNIDNRTRVFTLSARSKESLDRLILNYAEYFNRSPDISLSDICYTASTGRAHNNYRLAFPVRSYDDLKQKMQIILESGLWKTDSSCLQDIYFAQHRVVFEHIAARKDGDVTECEKRELNRLANDKVTEFLDSQINNENVLGEACQLFVTGADIEWERLYDYEEVRRISLPTYAFDRKRCWLEIPDAKLDVGGNECKDYYTIGWIRDDLVFKNMNSISKTVLLLRCENVKCESIALSLKEKGYEVIEAELGEKFIKVGKDKYFLGNWDKDFDRLLDDIEIQEITHIVHTSTITGKVEIDSIDELEKSQRDGVYSLFYLARAIIRRGIRNRINMLLVSEYVNGIGGEERINPENATLFGLADVLTNENSHIRCKCLDIDEITTANEVVDELIYGGDRCNVSYRKGFRYVGEFRNVKINCLNASEITIKDEGVYIITGGNGGLGLEIAKYLASKSKVNICLIGRSALPERLEWDRILENTANKKLCRSINKIKEIESMGANVTYYSSDISKYDKVKSILLELRGRYKKINGVIHCAGIAGRGYIANKSENAFTEVLLPKVYGTWILNKLTENDDLDFFVMFSSIATLLGLPSQGDYIAANSYMDSFAYYRQLKNSKLKTLTINWPAWKEAGMALEYGANIDSMMKALTTKKAIMCFDEILNKDINKVFIGELNLSSDEIHMFDMTSLRLSDDIMHDIQGKGGKYADDLRQGDSGTTEQTGEAAENFNEVESNIKHICKEVLRFEEISSDDNFFRLGADSIILTRLYEHIERRYPGKMSISQMFVYSSISKLTEFICSKERTITDKTEKGKERALCTDVAIIGMAARYPLAVNIEEFWDNIRNGIDCIGEFPCQRKDKMDKYVKHCGISEDGSEYTRAAYLSEIDKFDYNFFKLSPKEACLMDPNQRMFLETAFNAIEDSGHSNEGLKGSKTGVYIGFSNDIRFNYADFISEIEPSSLPISIIGNLSSVVPSRVSYYLDLKGPSMVIDTACSSSLVAVHLACKALIDGECDYAIAGGTRLYILPLASQPKIGIESADGRTKAFDNSSDGTGMGEGVAAIILKPLDKAIEDGDNIYAVIKGSAVNQDGNSIGITAPNVESQEEVIVNAWEYAGINPETISYIETHGTGTRLGDPIEIDGIQRAFRRYTDKKQFCAIGSIKMNIGHLFECSGITGLIKAASTLKRREIPPGINFERPNSNISFEESPIYVCDKLTKWEMESHPRRCGVSSFGFSGTNCHIVLEEAPFTSKERLIGKTPQVFTLSAKSEYSINGMLESYRKYMQGDNNADVEDICFTANVGRSHYNYRIAMVVKDGEELKEKIDNYIIGDTRGCGIYYEQHKILAGGKKKTQYYQITEEERKNLSDTARVKNREFIESGRTNTVLLDEICQLYVKGATVKWEELYEGREVKRVSLPLYAFERQKCWIEIPESCDSTVQEDSQFFTVSWQEEALYKDTSRTLHGAVLLFKGERGWSEEIVNQLNVEAKDVIEIEIGSEFRICDNSRYVISGSKDDYDRLMSEIKDRKLSQIVCLQTLGTTKEIDKLEQLEENLQKGVYSLFYLIKSILKYRNKDAIEIVLVSDYVNGVTGREERIKPENAALFGLGKIVGHEHDWISCRGIDIDKYTKAEDIINELNNGSEAYQVAYREGRRYVEEFGAVDLAAVSDIKSDIKENGVYVITGGTGGIGLEIAGNMASKNKVNIALINRTPIPKAEDWDYLINNGEDVRLCSRLKKIKQLESRGSKVICYSADVAKMEEMNLVLSEIRERFGKIDGIIHSAGIGGYGLIADKSEKRLREIMASKVYGTWILDRLTNKDELDFFVMFSSVATLFGAIGQSDYGAANSYLDSFAAYRNIRKARALAINWVAWKETGMAAEHGFIADTLFKAISTRQALKAYDSVIGKDISRVLIGEVNYKGTVINSINKYKLKISDEIKAKIEKYREKTKPKVKTIERKDCIEVVLTGKADENYTEKEKLLAQIWGEILGYKEIDISDDFFELGGDSMLAIRIIARVNEQMNINANFAEILNHSTIAGFAESIDKNYKKQDKNSIFFTLQPAEEKEYYPLSSAQKRLYALNQFDTGDTAYNVTVMLLIEGRFDTERCERALESLVNRHEAFRTIFEMINGEVVQKIIKNVEIRIEHYECKEEGLEDFIKSFISPFDLNTAPILRIAIIDITGDKRLLLLDMHHIISDGTSMKVLKKEFIALYKGENLPELKIQYKDYAVWQTKFLDTEFIKLKAEYWLNAFKGEIPLLDLPTDYTRPSVQSFEGDYICFSLDVQLSSKLNKLARDMKSTLFGVLLSSYSILLAKYSGKEDVVIGTPVEGREYEELENVIGIFLNILPMRNYPQGEKAFEEFLKEVNENALKAYENQYYQYEELVETLGIKRDTSRNPLFEVMFVMQNVEPNVDINLNNLKLVPYKFDDRISKFDILLEASEGESNLNCKLEYCTSLFKRETIEKMAAYFTKILETVTENVYIKLSDIDILSGEEKKELLGSIKKLKDVEDFSKINGPNNVKKSITADFDF